MTRSRRLGVAALGLAALWAAAARIRPTPVAPRPVFAGRAGQGPVVIAHRGGRHLGPESTLFQFRRAVAMGVDVLEFDVRPAAGGELVVLHDADVDRTTDGSGPVAGMTLDQVEALDAGYGWSPPQDSTTHPYRGQGLAIPTLEEVLAALPDQGMLIELKTPDDASAGRLCDALRRHGRTRQTVVASFHDEALQAFRGRCPEVATSASSAEVRSYWILHLLRLDLLASPRFQALQVPERVGPLRLVDRRFLDVAQERNLPVHVWTVDDRQDMERLVTLGVDGIITDRPDLLLDVLGRRTR